MLETNACAPDLGFRINYILEHDWTFALKSVLN